MDNQEFIELVDHDLKGAEPLHNDQISQIGEWIAQFDGEPYGNEDPNKSSIVWKIIKKQGETLISNLAKPFLGAHEIISLDPLTDKDSLKTPIYEKVNNHFWSKQFNANKFVKNLARVAVKEGTAFVRVGWEREVTESKEIVSGDMPADMQKRFQQRGATITRMEDGRLEVKRINVRKNRPTAKLVRNEDIYIDPTADTFEDSKFLIYEYTTSIGELITQPHLYDKAAVQKLKRAIEYQDDRKQTPFEGSHQYNEYSFQFTDQARTKVRLYEYWGKYDIDNKDVLESVVGIVARYGDDKVILRLEKNTLPTKRIPFVCVPLIEDEFAIYGRALADMIEDEQKFSTAIVRGIIDNMAASNNGTKFVRKNALDPINQERLLNGDPLVEVNTNETIASVIQDGVFNQLPSDVYNTLSMIEQQSESLTGVSKFMQGLPSTEMKASSANFSAVMSQSQIRLLDMTTSLTNGLRQIFYMWINMAMEYLDDDEIMDITGVYIPEMKVRETKKIAAEMQIDQLPKETQEQAMMLIIKEVEDMFNMRDLRYDVKMKVGTDGLKEIKIGQINMLMQQSGNLMQMGAVPPQVIGMLFADMAEAMDRPDIAKMVTGYQPQPDPMQTAMAEAELKKTTAEATKDEALAQNALARTETERAEAAERLKQTPIEAEGKALDNIAKVAKMQQDETKTQADAYAKVKGAQNVTSGKAS